MKKITIALALIALLANGHHACAENQNTSEKTIAEINSLPDGASDKAFVLNCKETNKYEDGTETKHNNIWYVDTVNSHIYNDKKQLLKHLQLESSDLNLKIVYDISFVYQVYNINRITGELTGNGHLKVGSRQSHTITGTCTKLDKLVPKF